MYTPFIFFEIQTNTKKLQNNISLKAYIISLSNYLWLQKKVYTFYFLDSNTNTKKVYTFLSYKPFNIKVFSIYLVSTLQPFYVQGCIPFLFLNSNTNTKKYALKLMLKACNTRVFSIYLVSRLKPFCVQGCILFATFLFLRFNSNKRFNNLKTFIYL